MSQVPQNHIEPPQGPAPLPDAASLIARAPDLSPRPGSGMLEVVKLSWPASLSMLNSTLMRFIDGLMVAHTGFLPMGAQLVAGIAAFTPESFATGLLSVTNTYVAQNLGAKRYEKCGQYAWAGVFLALAFCVMIVPLAFFSRPIFQLLQQPPELIELESMYFRYMVAAIFLTLTARPLEQFFYGVHRPRIVLAASLGSNVCHVGLNYIFIFGKLGLPAMGLEGAAIATLISWGLYMATLVAIFLSPQFNRQFATRRGFRIQVREVIDLARIGWPAGLQFINDVLPWSLMLSVLVGRFGATHIAASSAAMRWMPLSFMPAVGIGIATTALVGKYIGQGRPDLSRKRAHSALILAMIYMGMCGVAFWLLRSEMVLMFTQVDINGAMLVRGGALGQLWNSLGGGWLGAPTLAAAGTAMDVAHASAQVSEIVRVGAWVMVCAAIFQLFDAVGIVYVGALRGAGDTLFPMIVTIALSWGATIGLGYTLVVYVPQLTSIGPWIAGSVYVIILSALVARRFESGKWQKIDLLGKKDR